MNRSESTRPSNQAATERSASLLLLLLLPGLFISDLIYGALFIQGIELTPSPGQMTRGLVLAISGLLLISNRSMLLSGYGLFLFILCAMIAVSTVASPDFPTGLVFDIKAGARIVYGPFVVILFLWIFNRYQTTYRELLFYAELIFYGIGITLFLLSNLEIGQDTYGSYAYGFKGLFEPQNDVGLSATIAFAAALYGNMCRLSLLRLALLFVAMLGLAGMGTRTAMATPIVVSLAMAIIFLVVAFLRFENAKNLINLTVRLGLIVVLASLVSLHSYGMATGVRILPNPFSIGTDADITATDYQRMKMERTMKGEAHRKDLLERALKHTRGRTVFYDLIGEGTYTYRMGVAKYWPGLEPGEDRYAEMDWFDLYGQYGVPFSILLHVFYIFFLLVAAVNWISRRQVELGVFALMIGLYLSHSAIAGHAMNSPMASTQIAAVIAFLYLLRSGEPIASRIDTAHN